MPGKWVSISLLTPLGNLEGINLPALFEKKECYIGVPFLDPQNI